MGLLPAETHELVAARLGEAGRVYTSGRRELVELLVRTGRPASIHEVLELQLSLTQSSLYRNMTDLENVGVVRRVVGCDEPSRYELSVDIIGHHHHMVCTVCGVVQDFRMAPAAEAKLEEALVEALSEARFQPASHRLDVSGSCVGCP